MGNNGKVVEETENFSPKFNETTGFLGKVQKGVHGITSGFETILSIVLIVGIAIAFLRVPEKIADIFNGEDGALLNLVNFVALVIIAIELINVIIAQNLDSVIEILMLAFTRELVIRQWDMWQLLLGVGVIAGLFAVKKFLIKKES